MAAALLDSEAVDLSCHDARPSWSMRHSHSTKNRVSQVNGRLSRSRFPAAGDDPMDSHFVPHAQTRTSRAGTRAAPTPCAARRRIAQGPRPTGLLKRLHRGSRNETQSIRRLRLINLASHAGGWGVASHFNNSPKLKQFQAVLTSSRWPRHDGCLKSVHLDVPAGRAGSSPSSAAASTAASSDLK